MDSNKDALGGMFLLSAIQSKIGDIVSAQDYTSSETAESEALVYTELSIGLI